MDYSINFKGWRGYGANEEPWISGRSTVRVHSDTDGRVQRATAMTKMWDHLATNDRRWTRSSSTALHIVEVR